MFKGKVWPALLCNASSSLPPWKRWTARHIILAPTTAKAWGCWRRNRTANHSKAKSQPSPSLAHREAWGTAQEAGRCSPKAFRKRCWESYRNKRNSYWKMLLSKAKVTVRPTEGLCPTGWLPCCKDVFHTGVNICKNSAYTGLSSQLTDCDWWPRLSGLWGQGSSPAHLCTPPQQLSVFVLVGT